MLVVELLFHSVTLIASQITLLILQLHLCKENVDLKILKEVASTCLNGYLLSSKYLLVYIDI